MYFLRKNIPNLLTSLNLFTGCVSLYYLAMGKMEEGCYLIFLSAAFDFLDGFSARMLNVSSDIGKQLDSMADLVSFGVVPGFIMMKLLQITTTIYTIDGTMLAEPIALSGFLITVFSGIRLAKFNLDDRQNDSFIGLPTPANTALIASLAIIMFQDNKEITNFLLNIYLLLGLVILLSYLLVAEIPLMALKFKNFKWADNKLKFILIIIAAPLLAILQIGAIPIIIITYIILSLIENRINKQRPKTYI